jgi:hypothetical protein
MLKSLEEHFGVLYAHGWDALPALASPPRQDPVLGRTRSVTARAKAATTKGSTTKGKLFSSPVTKTPGRRTTAEIMDSGGDDEDDDDSDYAVDSEGDDEEPSQLLSLVASPTPLPPQDDVATILETANVCLFFTNQIHATLGMAPISSPPSPPATVEAATAFLEAMKKSRELADQALEARLLANPTASGPQPRGAKKTTKKSTAIGLPLVGIPTHSSDDDSEEPGLIPLDVDEMGQIHAGARGKKKTRAPLKQRHRTLRQRSAIDDAVWSTEDSSSDGSGGSGSDSEDFLEGRKGSRGKSNHKEKTIPPSFFRNKLKPPPGVLKVNPKFLFGRKNRNYGLENIVEFTASGTRSMHSWFITERFEDKEASHLHATCELRFLCTVVDWLILDATFVDKTVSGSSRVLDLLGRRITQLAGVLKEEYSWSVGSLFLDASCVKPQFLTGEARVEVATHAKKLGKIKDYLAPRTEKGKGKNGSTEKA